MTATRLQDSSSSWAWTCSGRLVSTTTTRERLSASHQGLLGTEEIPPVLGQLVQLIQACRLGGVGAPLPDDVGGDSLFPGDGAHARRGAGGSPCRASCGP